MTQKARDNSLTEVLATLRRRAWVIVACMLLVVAAAVVFSLFAEKQYTATSSLLARQESLSGDVFNDQAAFDVTDPERELQTNLRLLQLDEVRDRAAQLIGGGITAAEVDAKVDIEASEDSDVISINATSPDADLSADVANGFADAFVSFREQADREKVEQAQGRLESQLESDDLSPARRASLETRVDELQTLADLQTGGIELVQPADSPDSPSSPKPRRNALIGAFGGLLLGLGLVLVLEQVDRRVRRPEELQELLELPVVGTIPESSMISNGGPPNADDWRSAEAFRMFRASLLYFDAGREIKSVLVTSAAPGDGKTTIALGLAVAAAEPGLSVLLIEADLRRPTLGPRLGLRRSGGLTRVLRSRDQSSMVTAVQSVTVESPSNDGAPVVINVLPAGPHPPNAAELMESETMSEVLEAAERDYDLVVVDTSPVGVISDPIPLFDQVSGVVVVAGMKETTRESARRLKAQLDSVKPPLLGVVANFAKPGAGYSAYEYYGEQERKSPSK